MNLYTVLILFVSHSIFAQYDTINFENIIINKKYLLHTDNEGFPIKEEGKTQNFKWKELVEIGELTYNIPFYKEIYDDEYYYEMKWDIGYLYNANIPNYIYIDRISPCKMYKIYFRINDKLVYINGKNKNFFAKKFPKSYQTYLKNRNKRNSGFFIQLKKGNDYGYITIHFKNDKIFEQISVHQEIN